MRFDFVVGCSNEINSFLSHKQSSCLTGSCQHIALNIKFISKDLNCSVSKVICLQYLHESFEPSPKHIINTIH